MTRQPLTPAAAPQGEFLGLPYDFRRPTLARLRARVWQPGGPLLTPHLWGWGFTFNLAHPGTWTLAALVALTATLAAVFG